VKRPQTKFSADTVSHLKVIKSKKSQNSLLRQNLSLGQNFLAAEFFPHRYFIKVTTTDFDMFLQV